MDGLPRRSWVEKPKRRNCNSRHAIHGPSAVIRNGLAGIQSRPFAGLRDSGFPVKETVRRLEASAKFRMDTAGCRLCIESELAEKIFDCPALPSAHSLKARHFLLRNPLPQNNKTRPSLFETNASSLHQIIESYLDCSPHYPACRSLECYL
jgi:hypothetical protein